MSKTEKVDNEVYANQNYLNFIKKNHKILNSTSQRRGRQHDSEHSCEKCKIYECENTKQCYNYNSERELLHNYVTKNEGSICEIHCKEKPRKVKHGSLNQFLSKLDQVSLTNLYNLTNKNVNVNPISHSSDQNYQKQLANLLREKWGIISEQSNKSVKHDMSVHMDRSKKIDIKQQELKQTKVRVTKALAERLEMREVGGEERGKMKFPVIDYRRQKAMRMETESNSQKGEKFGENCKHGSGMLPKYEGKLTADLKQRIEDYEREEMDRLIYRTEKKLSMKFRLREEMYGLLPVFHTPYVVHDIKRSKFLMNKCKPVNGEKTGRKREEYGEINDNIILKSWSLQPNLQDKVIESKMSGEMTQLVAVGSMSEVLCCNNPLPKDNCPSHSKEPQGPSHPMSLPPKNSNCKVKAKRHHRKEFEPQYDSEVTIYELKMRDYREFLFMMNIAHRRFDVLLLKNPETLKLENRYKFFVGKGNNAMLIRSLLKRRFWWVMEEDMRKANMVWSQLKINEYYELETRVEVVDRYCKIEVEQEGRILEKRKRERVPEPRQVKQSAFKAPLPANPLKIFTRSDKQHYDNFLSQTDSSKMQKYSNRLRYFPSNQFLPSCEPSCSHMHNHLECNYFIGNKKALFYNLKQYYELLGKDVFTIIPLTYHIRGVGDTQFEVFVKEFKRGKMSASKNVWIVKPGELSNRGQGITVINSLNQLLAILKKKERHQNGVEKTYIVQKYIENPLLYKGRKFDIRHYMLITRLYGRMRAYWFGEGYIRTSSHDYDINELDNEMVHLTNDAIQKHSEEYGKYEEGNKVSYSEFQRYMDSYHPDSEFSFVKAVYPRMMEIGLDAIKATYLKLDPKCFEHNFEILGLDFMIDSAYRIKLIEINTNPCLELSSKLLSRVIPTMVEQTLRLTLDVVFPPPTHYPNSQKHLAPDNVLERLQYELIFDEDRDGKEISKIFEGVKTEGMGEVDEEDETYDNEGKEIDLDIELV